MTLREYQREAVVVLEANGMTWTQIAKVILKTPDGHGVEELVEGQREQTLLKLERLEAASGVSLDEVDPRIHRGEALAAGLAQAAREHKWTQAALAATLGISQTTLRGVLALGKLGAFVKPSTAIALCDIMEGRSEVLPVVRGEAGEGAAQRFLALPPEARGDSAYLTARRAFWKCVGSNPKNFRLRRAECPESLFLAEGPAISYRFLVNGDRVRFTARIRKSGFTLTTREVWA